ncbi:hypothetical protein B0H11DRAFT_2278790 [Mycena galericulata]|nr:hypothetical protein B0H11DRAFT_2278790 [Mycena galericulata]
MSAPRVSVPRRLAVLARCGRRSGGISHSRTRDVRARIRAGGTRAACSALPIVRVAAATSGRTHAPPSGFKFASGSAGTFAAGGGARLEVQQSLMVRGRYYKPSMMTMEARVRERGS